MEYLMVRGPKATQRRGCQQTLKSVRDWKLQATQDLKGLEYYDLAITIWKHFGPLGGNDVTWIWTRRTERTLGFNVP
jgi:hypothetical protein